MMVARGGRGDEARAEEALLSVCTGLAAPWVFTCLAQCQGAPAGTITVSWERSPPNPHPVPQMKLRIHTHGEQGKPSPAGALAELVHDTVIPS